MNIDKIINKLKNYSVVSFDIFDTLLKRNVEEPTQIFKFVEERYNKLYNYKINSFIKNRINAEKKSRKKSIYEDIDIKSIYEEMSSYTQMERKRLLQLELNIEEEFIVANNFIKPIYEYCIKSKKKIIITSDMYLPRTFLEKLLKKNGFDEFCYLFVSSETKVLKSSGNMFKYILDKLNLNSKQVIHIGDAIKGDYIMPRTIGINTIRISRNIYNTRYIHKNEKGIEINSLKMFINNNINVKDDAMFNIGYENFGILLYNFSEWLHNNIQNLGINKILFFSRDGYIMKKSFDKIYKNIDTEYCYVSRRSLTVPLLWKNYELNQLIKIIPMTRFFSIKVFFERVGLNSSDYYALLKKYEFSETYIISAKNILDNNKFLELYDEIKSDVIKNSKLEYKNLLGYLKQMNLKGNIAIVDIGWKGTMQKSLQSIIDMSNLSVNIYGFYMGITNINNKKENYYGYLFDSNSEKDYLSNVFSFTGLFETFFLARHGSVKKYYFNNGKYYPDFYPYEYKNSIEISNVENIQKGAMKLISDYINSPIKKYIRLNSQEAFYGMFLLGTNPSRRDVRIFGNMCFFDSTKNNLAKPKPIYKYLVNFKLFITDFSESAWKIAFMKRLFKIKLPYLKIYKKLRDY